MRTHTKNIKSPWKYFVTQKNKVIKSLKVHQNFFLLETNGKVRNQLLHILNKMEGDLYLFIIDRMVHNKKVELKL